MQIKNQHELLQDEYDLSQRMITVTVKRITDNENDLCNTSILLHFTYTNDLFR